MSDFLLGNRTLNRGDIFIYNFGVKNGSTQAGVRPAVVIQTDNHNKKSPTTIIAPITTSLKRITMRSHIVIGKGYGLKDDSMILLEQLRVVNQNELFEYVGSIDDADVMTKIEDGLKSIFGIRTRRFVNNEIKKLCPSCFSKMLERDTSIIRRVDSFEKKIYACECCGKNANRYFVIPKQSCKEHVSSVRLKDKSCNRMDARGGANE